MANPRKALIETDFLFGLSSSNNLYQHVIKWLKEHKAKKFKLILSGISPVEVVATLLSRGFKLEVITQVLNAMNLKLHEYGVKEYSTPTIPILQLATTLRVNHHELTFFDSIHLATAINQELPLITSDQTLLKIANNKGIKAINLKLI
ncbi:MAG: hypothetical protein DRJ26_03825 [Candidatus Methanomethylicota archaeon]|uniref:PIN domain-containing protein n=1 Tax=Thermoproteota archaeon TaxID=2056631 RepID=A0A497F1B3_9CREN|nr:MAG: hypothetical protein DRJ26_03825 [Candidatus Verstraetearchaeota archaeon]